MTPPILSAPSTCTCLYPPLILFLVAIDSSFASLLSELLASTCRPVPSTSAHIPKFLLPLHLPAPPGDGCCLCAPRLWSGLSGVLVEDNDPIRAPHQFS
ncbi:hypothetical protein B0H13DRAFT_2362742 [Mycena leptocephala]|nr:hypothetical protein B0H13DRAFT_2362742 [Mycena leptocephala]